MGNDLLKKNNVFTKASLKVKLHDLLKQLSHKTTSWLFVFRITKLNLRYYSLYVLVIKQKSKSNFINRICVLASNAVDRRFESLSDQIKDCQIGMCCFSA